MVPVSLKMPKRLAAQVRAAARERGLSKSALIREAIESYLAGYAPPVPSALDMAADLVGSWEGPPDLSTNPKYMEGFGE